MYIKTRKNMVFNGEKQINNVLVLGLVFRLLFLAVVLLAFSGTRNLYMFSDDRNYEILARRYLESASGVIDINAFKSIGASNYLQVFWPWVVCAFGYIFRTEYAGRFINILLSAVIIKIIYNLVVLIAEDEKMALRAAEMYAFFPACVIFSCFSFKDTYISLAVFYTFETMIFFQNNRSLTIKRIIINVMLLIGLYFSRGAVTELLIIFFLGLVLVEAKKERKIIRFWIVILLIAILFGKYYQEIQGVFKKKLEDYFFTDYARTTEATIAAIRIDSIWQIWKLPLAYMFALLNPFTLWVYNPSVSTICAFLYSIGNVTVFPIAIGNVLYVFKQKENAYFWITSMIIYLSTIIMSLGISRHYFFLYPMMLINYVLYSRKATVKERINLRWATIGLIGLVAVLSVRKAIY